MLLLLLLMMNRGRLLIVLLMVLLLIMHLHQIRIAPVHIIAQPSLMTLSR